MDWGRYFFGHLDPQGVGVKDLRLQLYQLSFRALKIQVRSSRFKFLKFKCLDLQEVHNTGSSKTR